MTLSIYMKNMFTMTILVLLFGQVVLYQIDDHSEQKQPHELKPHQRRVNVTSITTKQAKLPCFVQAGRKFIWMQANRDEIISIDGNVITADRRFSVEQTARCRTKSTGDETRRRALPDPFAIVIMSGQNQSVAQTIRDDLVIDGDHDGCWVYLVINSVSLYDEGLYVCQIDTMTSTLVYLNILGELKGKIKLIL